MAKKDELNFENENGASQQPSNEKLKALHINDSLNPAGAHKDRHAKIGEGWLGLEAIRKVVHDPRLEDLPCILETPQEDLSGYAREIKLLR